MAYNLNYNPGVEYENHRRNRKILIIVIAVLIILVLAIVIYVGFKNDKAKQDQNGSSFNDMSDAEKQALLRSMSSEGTTTIISPEEQPQLLQGMSAQEGANGQSQKETVSGSEQDNLIKSMSAN